MSARPWLWLVLLLSVHAVSAQVEPMFRAFGRSQGLPSGTVPKIVQDARGLLWLATRDGLVRYDGIGFKVYQNDPQQAQSLACNDVQTVFEDRQQRLWIGCSETGINRLVDAEAGRFDRGVGNFAALGLPTLDVYSIAQSPAGSLWLGTWPRGVLMLDPASGGLTPLASIIPAAAGLQDLTVLEVLADHSGDLWIAAREGLWRIRQIDHPAQARVESLLKDKLTISLFESDGGEIWVGTIDAVYRMPAAAAGSALTTVATGEVLRGVEAFAEDTEGSVWIGSHSGLTRIFRNGAVQQIRPRAAVHDSLPEGGVIDLLRDREGGLWIGMRSYGLSYVQPNWQSFELIRHDALDANTLPPGVLAGLAECRDGSHWVVTRFGNLAAVAANGTVTRYGETRSVADSGRVPRSLWCDVEQNLWIGHALGITRYQPTSGQQRHWGAAQGLVPGVVDLITADAHGAVWMTSLASGVSRIDQHGQVSTWQTPDRGIPVADFEQISTAPDGSVWLAGAFGMRRFDPQQQVFAALPGGPTARVDSFGFAADGLLWTHGGAGIEQWQIGASGAKRRLHFADQALGLPAVALSSLVVDDAGALWLIGERGVWQLQLDPLKLLAINARHGLPNLQFGIHPSALWSTGRLVDITQEGLLRFAPTTPPRAELAPTLYLAQASVRRGEERVLLPIDGQPWQLRWDDRDLKVAARVLSYIDPNANQYDFRLLGYEPSWVSTEARPEREFSRIEPGAYQLGIRAVGANGQAAVNEWVQPLRVATPPWRTPQAWTLYALTLIVGAWLVLNWYRVGIERRHRIALGDARRALAERANQAKSDFLADIGHEIRTPMAGVLGMAELLIRSTLDSNQHRWAVSVQRSGEHMLRLINDLLDLSKIEAGMLQIEHVPTDLRMLVDEVRALESALALARGIEFRVDLATDVPIQVSTDARRLRQILLNLVTNALKFTERGTVQISVTHGPGDQVTFAVSDTGPGMNEEQLQQLFVRFRQTGSGEHAGGSGLGLAITARLVELLGGKISVSSQFGVGSTFSVMLDLPPLATPLPTLRPEPAHTDSQPLQGIQLLLVEDDAPIREVMSHLLSALGAKVDAAQHGLDALAQFRPQQHRMLVLDLDLPGIDGISLLGLLRARAGPEWFAVAVTARSESDLEQRCRNAGFSAFLRKPVAAEVLADAARDWVKPKRSERQT